MSGIEKIKLLNVHAGIKRGYTMNEILKKNAIAIIQVLAVLTAGWLAIELFLYLT